MATDGLEIRVTTMEDALDALQREVESLREDLRALATTVQEERAG